MNVHAVFRNAALLAGIGIALQGLEALLVPVWAIVALVAALPATVVFAALVCPGALEAAITIVSIRSSYAGKGLATVFADEGLFFANMKAVLLGGAFTGTGFRTEALGLAVPIRWIKLNKLLAAVIARERDRSEAFPVSDAHAFAGTILSLSAWKMKKRNATNVAGCCGARNSCGHFHTSDSTGREKNGGAFLGMNACQQVANLLKPYTKYIMKHRISQGGFYACC